MHDEAVDKKLLLDLASANGIEAESCHWSSDEIAKSLPKVVEKSGINVVVMGSMSRSKLDQILIGSTAERLLDRLECDVLLLRPDS